MMFDLRLVAILPFLVLGACGDDDGGDASSDAAVDARVADAGGEIDVGASPDECARGALADDFESSPWLGPGADAESGELTDPDSMVIVATTYAAIAPGAEEEFGMRINAITGQIMMSPGVHAIRFGSSEECGVGRTITLWNSLAEMTDFVFSGVHLDALRNASTLTLPRSATTHYMGTSGEDFEWARATAELASVDTFGE